MLVVVIIIKRIQQISANTSTNATEKPSKYKDLSVKE